jgi:hypothetical protein
MKTIKVEVKSAEAASRKELLVRFAWGLAGSITYGIIGMFASLAMVVQWLHILFTRKRHPALQKFINSWYIGYTKFKLYLYLATDERPPLVPDF